MRSNVCLGLVASLLAGCGRAGQVEPVYIGHLAALQATDKSRFEHTRQGMTLALEEVNQQHGTAPARQVVVLHVDADEDLDKLQASAVRLLTVNRAIALIGGHDAAQVERLTRAVQPYEAPLIAVAMTAPALASDSLFSLEPSPSRVAKVVARWLNETVKGDVLAIAFDTHSPVATSLATAVRAELPQGRIIEASFSSQPKVDEVCEQICQSKTKAWLFFGKPEDWQGIRRALREAGSKIPCLVLDSMGPVETLPTVSPSEGEVYQLTTYFFDDQDKSSLAFQSNYAKRFHSDPDLYAAQGYDAVRLIAEASSSGKTITAGKLAVELSAFFMAPYASCTGPLWFEQPDHTANRTLFLIQKTDKQPKLISRVDPTPPG